MFPTPNTLDYLPPMDREKRLNHPSRKGRKVSGNLREEVVYRMFPTPTVDDSKNNGNKSQFNRKSNGKPRALNLNAEVVARDKDLNPGDGVLNPNWVEWLMGFPIGWTDLKDSETQ
jgi:DNA (cytosine-5)-methyltransferase 1